jgi:uncharacterized protein YqgC (DUF456 family)
MDWDILATVVAGILLVVAAAGVLYPVLPGSPIAIATLLVWAAVVGGWAAWVPAVIGALLCAAGWSASYLLAGRRLKQLGVPWWSVAVAAAAGLVGMFLIPVVGIFVGFAVGLLASEAMRHQDLRRAARYSIETLKAMGKGVLAEFALLCAAAAVWSAGVIVHFFTR